MVAAARREVADGPGAGEHGDSNSPGQTSHTGRGHRAGPALDPLTRVAFRFCFVYLGLYCFATHIVGGLILFPNFSFPSLGTEWPMRQITFWLAAHLFGVTSPLVYAGNSGDTTFHWVQTCWLLIVSALAAAIWSQLDRGREHYIALAQMVSSVRSFRTGRPDVLLRTGQGHSDAVPAAVARHARRTGRQSVADGPAVDVHRRVDGVSNLHRLRGGARRDPAGRPADHDAGRADLPGRHDSGLRAEHDLRLRPQAHLVPPDPDVADPAGAGFPASRQPVRPGPRGADRLLTRRCSARRRANRLALVAADPVRCLSDGDVHAPRR